MTDYNYYEYVFKSGAIIFISYKMERKGWTLFFNFTQGKDNIKTFDSGHPVREKAREEHKSL